MKTLPINCFRIFNLLIYLSWIIFNLTKLYSNLNRLIVLLFVKLWSNYSLKSSLFLIQKILYLIQFDHFSKYLNLNFQLEFLYFILFIVYFLNLVFYSIILEILEVLISFYQALFNAKYSVLFKNGSDQK